MNDTWAIILSHCLTPPDHIQNFSALSTNFEYNYKALVYFLYDRDKSVRDPKCSQNFEQDLMVSGVKSLDQVHKDGPGIL